LGVGALSVCNINLIDDEMRRAGLSARYRVIGNSGPCDYVPEEYRDRVEFVHFSAKNFLKSPVDITKSISGCDLVFDIGEGDSFADIYGLSRFLKLSYSKYVSILARTPLVLSPQTIGPFNGRFGRALGGGVMRSAQAVVARDFMSRSVLDRFALSNAHEAIDVAFILPFDRPVKREGGEKIRFGLNVSGLLFHGGYNGKNQFGLQCDYAAFTRNLIKRLLAAGNIEVHLVAHVVSIQNPVEDDHKVCMELQREFPGVQVSPRFRSPSEAKSYIAKLDIFSGARMHATVAAFSSGVPVMPLAYSRKFAGLFESIGYQRVLDMRSLDQESLIDGVLSGIRDIDAMTEELSTAQLQVDERLNVYRNVIQNAIATLGGK
jgi:polysaccharide pyruvyl transferase WcaK-like protein